MTSFSQEWRNSMAREYKISFADLKDGRQVAQKLGMSSIELIRVVKDKTQKEGMSRAEFQKFCEKVFNTDKK